MKRKNIVICLLVISIILVIALIFRDNNRLSEILNKPELAENVEESVAPTVVEDSKEESIEEQR